MLIALKKTKPIQLIGNLLHFHISTYPTSTHPHIHTHTHTHTHTHPHTPTNKNLPNPPPSRPPYLFTLRECQTAVATGNSVLKCPLSSPPTTVLAKLMVPDLTMSSLGGCQIQYEEVKILDKIGQVMFFFFFIVSCEL